MKTWMVAVTMLAGALVLGGCEKKEETAGQKLDGAIKTAGDATKDAAAKAEAAAKDAAAKANEALKK